MVDKAASSGTVSSSSHRLPTVSASDTLRQLRIAGTRTISTGLPILDRILVGHALATYGHGGLVRGQLTEIFGPPGAGKTALCLQAVATVLRDAGHVTWIDCGFSVSPARLRRAQSGDTDVAPTAFHHYRTSELAHLLSLCHHQQSSFPPAGTSLLVIENLSSIFHPTFTRPGNAAAANSNRSLTSLLRSTLLSALTRIASTSNIAVIITSSVTTRFRQESRALLTGAFAGKDWEEPISSRIALFRDFAPREIHQANILEVHDDDTLARIRFAGVLKANGIIATDNDWFKDVIPFTISRDGGVLPITVPMPSSAPVLIKSPTARRKRRLDEIPDSEDDWDAEIESLDGYEFEPEAVQDDVFLTSIVSKAADNGSPTPAERNKRAKVADDNDNVS